jgi:hypothetical protein
MILMFQESITIPMALCTNEENNMDSNHDNLIKKYFNYNRLS